VKSNYELLFYPCMQAIIKPLQDLCSMNTLCVHGKGYIVSQLHQLYTTTSCAASTHLPAATTLPQLRRASVCLGSSRGSSSTTSLCGRLRPQRLYSHYAVCHRDIVSRPHRLYLNLTVHSDYLSPSRTGSTSTSPCTVATCL
jgi:hypothetical protein